jgi:hypothetical protein
VNGEIGVRVTEAVADFVESAALVAITVTDCWLVMLAGAVYRPVALIPPTPVVGLSVQFTVWLLVLATVALNCDVWSCANVAVTGVTLTDTGRALIVKLCATCGAAA